MTPKLTHKMYYALEKHLSGAYMYSNAIKKMHTHHKSVHIPSMSSKATNNLFSKELLT